MNEPEKWPNHVTQVAAGNLFPTALTVDELMALTQRTAKTKAQVDGWSWTMRQIVQQIAPLSSPADDLREALTSLLWQGRHKEQESYRLRGRFDHFSPALAGLCYRQIKSLPASTPSPRLIWACAVANRFYDNDANGGQLIKQLRKHFASSPILREAAFWSELKLLAEASQAGSAREQYVRTEHGSLIDRLTTDDRRWLLEALEGSEDNRRLIAFQALISLWDRSNRPTDHINELMTAVREDANLTELLRQKITAEPDPEIEKWNREDRQRMLERKIQKHQRLEGWTYWKDQLVTNPEAAFAPEELATTTLYLYDWLNARQGSETSFNVWNVDVLRAALGNGIAARAEEAFKAAWRAHVPTLWNQRSPEDRNRGLLVWNEGLTGLAAEAATPGWANRLTPDEARIAAVYATIELNGFTSWLPELSAAQPTIVDEVIGGELTAELAAAAEHSHLPVLQDLSHADVSIKRLLASRLLAVLPTWPSTFRDEECSRHLAHHLRRVIGILSDVADDPQRAAAAGVCRRYYLNDPGGPLSLTWLRGLFLFDPEEATQALEIGLASLPAHERTDRATTVFANLFGEHTLTFTFADNRARVSSLSRLISLAYCYVCPSDDQEHEGAYSPNIRDRAQTGRNFLLGSLLETPGAEAQKAIHDLILDTAFGHVPDRLRLLARRRAASDAERAALSPEEVVALESRFEVPPHDRNSLFNVMVDRLDDLAHNIAHDDFSDRRTLRTITDEIEMQRTLARRLRDMEKGAYIVVREEEVADLKKPDIRLAAVRGEQKAAIEVKIADNWSLTALEQALRHQLLGQYLRHDTCKAGCLLLTYNGTKNYWRHPENGELNFPAMIEHLRSQARSIEYESLHAVRLTVFPLDLTDPPVNS